MQAEPLKYNKGMVNAFGLIVKEHGVSYLAAGLMPTLVGYAIEGSMKFGIYEALKPKLSKIIASKANAFIVSSIFAGGVASILLCPLEAVRIRLVTQPNYANGLIAGMSKWISNEGVLSTMDGLGAMVCKQIPYTTTKQVSFDILAGILYNIAVNAGLNPKELKWGISFFAAFGASILSCLLSQPGDMVLTQTYKSSSPEPASRIIAKIYKEGGIPAFFTGTGARLVHVIMIVTSQLMFYDVLKIVLGLPITGSH